MIFYNLNFNYKFIKKKKIKKISRIILFKNINICINFVNLLSIYIMNKIYKKIKKPTNTLIFNNNIFKNKNYDIYICNIMIESESILFFKNLNYYYIFLIIHNFLHCQNFNHKIFFFKKNILNFLELKFFYKLGFYNFYNNNLIYYKYFN